jgi:hypothetical protein
MPNFCPCGCGLNVSKLGVYRKDHQPLGTPRDPQGKDKAANDINNPIWNPINNPINGPINRRKKKLSRRAKATAYLHKHGRTGIMHIRELSDVAKELAEDRTLFDGKSDSRLHGMSLDDLFAREDFSGYLGETMQPLADEAFRWLTQRGSQFHASGKNRPVLRWRRQRAAGIGKRRKASTIITATEANEELGFGAIMLYRNEEKPNTCGVEDLLQERYHELGLPRRLHRQIGMGDNGWGRDDEPGVDELHGVFLTYSFDVQEAIEAGEVDVIHGRHDGAAERLG